MLAKLSKTRIVNPATVMIATRRDGGDVELCHVGTHFTRHHGPEADDYWQLLCAAAGAGILFKVNDTLLLAIGSVVESERLDGGRGLKLTFTGGGSAELREGEGRIVWEALCDNCDLGTADAGGPGQPKLVKPGGVVLAAAGPKRKR